MPCTALSGVVSTVAVVRRRTASAARAIENWPSTIVSTPSRPAAASATTHVYSQARGGNAPDGPPEGAREITYTKAAWEALAEAMERDPGVFVLGEGIGQRGGNFRTTEGLYDRYGPIRLRDTPIAERGFVGLAGGAAMTGTRPVVDFIASGIAKAVAQPDVQAKLAELGADPYPMGPAEFVQLVRRDQDRWMRLIRERKLKMD